MKIRFVPAIIGCVMATGINLAHAAPVHSIDTQPTTSQATVLTHITTEHMERLLRSQGYAFSIDEDGNLLWMHEGYKSIVLISREKNNLMFKAVFTDGAGSLETVNNWNQNVRFSRSYMSDEGETILELDLDLDGGVTEQHVIEWLKVCHDSFRLWLNDVVLASP